MVRTARAALMLVFALVLVTSCATSDVKADAFQSALKDKTDFTAAQATCVTDATYKQLTQKQINKLYTANDTKDVDDTVGSAFTKIIQGCVKG